MNPRVSINISCFNRADKLRGCLQSFIDQSFTDFEIVVVDDGSDDDLSFVSNLDKRIKYIRQEKNHGMSSGLNKAFDESAGEFIMPFGSDDVALPGLIEVLVKELDNNERIDIVYSDSWISGKNGRYRRKLKSFNNNSLLYEEMLKGQCISHGGTLWRKNKYPKLDETVSPAEDWELFLAALEKGLKFKHIPERLWIYDETGEDRMSRYPEMADKCDEVLNRRGYYYDKKQKIGKKICN